MTIYEGIEKLMSECHSINTDFANTKQIITSLNKSEKHKVSTDINMRMKAIVNNKKHQKQQIICAILGISDIEYIKIISKTTEIKHLGGSNYLFLEDSFKLKEVKLHLNSIKVICKYMGIKTS